MYAERLWRQNTSAQRRCPVLPVLVSLCVVLHVSRYRLAAPHIGQLWHANILYCVLYVVLLNCVVFILKWWTVFLHSAEQGQKERRYWRMSSTVACLLSGSNELTDLWRQRIIDLNWFPAEKKLCCCQLDAVSIFDKRQTWNQWCL